MKPVAITGFIIFRIPHFEQLGKSLPASSLMFAKFSPDGSKAAYVSGHNIYVEDLNSQYYQTAYP